MNRFALDREGLPTGGDIAVRRLPADVVATVLEVADGEPPAQIRAGPVRLGARLGVLREDFELRDVDLLHRVEVMEGEGGRDVAANEGPSGGDVRRRGAAIEDGGANEKRWPGPGLRATASQRIPVHECLLWIVPNGEAPTAMKIPPVPDCLGD